MDEEVVEKSPRAEELKEDACVKSGTERECEW